MANGAEVSPKDGLASIRRWLDMIAGRISTWEARRPVLWMGLVVLIATGISLGSRFPDYTSPYAKFPGNFVAFPGTPYGQAVTWWVEHPFQPVPVDVFFPPETRKDPVIAGSVSHLDKLTFRVFLPMLNQLIRGGSWTVVIANHAAMLATFLLLYLICSRITGDAVQATALVWAYAATWAGAWGFNDLVCGDTVAVALMLAALAGRRSWVVTFWVFAAAFTDERVVFAAPLLGLFRFWHAAPPASDQSLKPMIAAVLPVGCGIAAYGVCRLWVGYQLNVSTGTSMLAGTEILFYHLFVSYPAKIFAVFEFLWLLPLGFVLGGASAGPRANRAAWRFFAVTLIAAVPAVLVWDINRSLCYLLPAVLGAACFFPAESGSRRRLMLVVAAASLAWVEIYGTVVRRLLL